MRLLTLPVTAVLSCVATNWYWLGQEYRHEALRAIQRQQLPLKLPQEQPPGLSKHLEAECADVAGIREALEERERHIRELEAVLQSAPTANDPFSDLFAAVWRIQRLAEDMARFAIEAAAAHIWPWPIDIAPVVPAPAAAAGLAPGLWEAAQHLAASLAALVPPAASTQLQEVVGAVNEATRDSLEEVNRSLEAFRAAIRLAIRSFLDRHPEHGVGLLERDPFFVVAFFLIGGGLLVLDAYLCAKLAARLAWFGLRLLLPLRCDDRQPAVPADGGPEAPAAPALLTSTLPPSPEALSPKAGKSRRRRSAAGRPDEALKAED